MFNFDLADIIARLIIIFVCFPIHELAHGWVAYMLGDDTPKRDGRLTLNPLAHIDPIGAFLIMIGSLGWTKPVRFNPANMTKVKNPRVGLALTAIAGPLANLALAMAFAIPLRLGIYTLFDWNTGQRVINVFLYPAMLNISLAAFNLLPIYPLDGAKVLIAFAPASFAPVVRAMQRYSILVFILIIFILPELGFDLLDILVTPILEFFTNVLFAW